MKKGALKQKRKAASKGGKKACSKTAKQYLQGQADALEGEAWQEWEAHCGKTAPPWLYVFVVMSCVLATRVLETVKMQGLSFTRGLKHAIIEPVKNHGREVKQLLPEDIKKLKKLRSKGFCNTRVLKAGRSSRKVTEKWTWSNKYLFPAARGKGHMTPNTVQKAFRRARDSFQPSSPFVQVKKIRPHSARHRFANDCKRTNVSPFVAMGFMLITNRRTFDRVYGNVSTRQAGEALSRDRRLRAARPKH